MTPSRWRFPPAETYELENGMRVKLVDMPGKLVATVGISIAVPTGVESRTAEGALWAHGSMLLSDAPHRRSGHAADLARVGATVNVGSDHRGTKVVADCPVPHLATLFEELASMVLAYSPTVSSFEACRRQRLADLAFEAADPAGLANTLFHESVLSQESRYSRPVGGSAEQWESLEMDEVVALHDQYVGPGCVSLVVVGDLGHLDVRRAVLDTFGRYDPVSTVEGADDPPLPAIGPPHLRRRPTPASATTTYLILGCFAIDRLDPRWPSARIGAELLAGNADSLLNRALRDRLGVSYGVRCKFLPYYTGGTFSISGAVDGARSELALAEVLHLLGVVAQDGFDTGELSRTQAEMTTSAPEIYESTLAVAQQYIELASCGISASFIDDHLRRVAAMDPKTLDEEFRSLVQPERMHLAVVGDFDPATSVVSDLPRS